MAEETTQYPVLRGGDVWQRGQVGNYAARHGMREA
jgi:hypothetical protein